MLVSPLSSLTDLENAAHVSDLAKITDEPLLCMDNIQGNGLVGFSKDHQFFIFLKIQDRDSFKQWLASQINFVATAAEVLAFNRLFKAVKSRRGQEGAVKATWMNIVLSAPALKQLLSAADFSTISDASFLNGLAAQSASLNDPTGSTATGSPTNWKVGGPGNEADVMLIVASDDQGDMRTEVERLRASIALLNTAKPCLTEIFSQEGATLLGEMRGHEHFGWRDGVSQPGVRGVISADKTADNRIDLLTTRQNPNDASQGQPGQDCLFPGDFLFGYPGQDPKNPDAPGPFSNGGSNLFDDGSLVVVRRLQQDVPGFQTMLTSKAHVDDVDGALLGAKLVGRFKDGSPIVIDDSIAHADIGGDDARANWFEFQDVPPHTTARSDDSQFDLTGVSPSNDPEGAKCPFAAHIRKMYPRDDQNATGLNEADTQTHRMLRRGIPFGTAYNPTVATDDADRGLFFVSYQTSIIGQFEFATKNWANTVDFKQRNAGYDPIIGQSDAPDRNRSTVTITFTGDRDPIEVDLRSDFVIPTGGGYFVSLSIDALASLAGTPNAPVRCHGGHPPIAKPPTPVPTGY